MCIKTHSPFTNRVAAYDNYDVFYDKATGWVVYLKETSGGGEVPNYTVTYSIEMVETNAALSPPLPSGFHTSIF